MIRSRFKHRGRKAGKGGSSHGMPALIPMIDMLTIMVVYLLVHAADYEILPNTKNISIPMSMAEKAPRETITMLVTRDDLFVNGAKVMTVAALDALEAALMSGQGADPAFAARAWAEAEPSRPEIAAFRAADARRLAPARRRNRPAVTAGEAHP